VLGQHLVSGVDVWLNTPLRPNEACGTSGMKVLVNGGLNVSILDGWWDEAVEFSDDKLRPGWIVGTRETGGYDALNTRDAASMFDVLENQVIPEFYERDEQGLPTRWIERVRRSMVQLTPRFSATRMLHQYVAESYLPAARAFASRSKDNALKAQEIRNWTDLLHSRWNHVRVGQIRWKQLDGQHEISVECWLEAIPLQSVRVEIFAERSVSLQGPHVVPLEVRRELPGSIQGYIFAGRLSGDCRPDEYTVRIVPHHADAYVPAECNCILWDR
jgi:starch phosphorylase